LHSSGKVKDIIGLNANIRNRHVVILEDIIDSGATIDSLLPVLQDKDPASLALCTFLIKPDALQYPIEPDYKCFEIPNDFVVGYGLDYDGLGRNYPQIYSKV
jgi:hypoxanthine phosphoribosyltransferase